MSEIQFSQDYLPVAVLRLYANVGSCVQVHSLQSHNGTISLTPPPPSTFYCELSLISLSVVIRCLCRGESWQTQDPFQNSIKFCILQDAPEGASNVQTNY